MTDNVEALPCFLDGQQHRALAVHPYDIGLRRRPVTYPGDILHVDRGVPDRFNWNSVEVLHCLRRSIGHIDVVFFAPNLGRASRQDQVLQSDRINHIQCGQSLRLQRTGIQVHLHLPLLSAVGIRHGCSRDSDELGANVVETVVIQLLLGKPLAGECQLQHRHTGCAVSQNQWRGGSGRQLPQLRLRNRCDLCNPTLYIGCWLQEDLYYGDAV